MSAVAVKVRQANLGSTIDVFMRVLLSKTSTLVRARSSPAHRRRSKPSFREYSCPATSPSGNQAFTTVVLRLAQTVDALELSTIEQGSRPRNGEPSVLASDPDRSPAHRPAIGGDAPRLTGVYGLG